MENETVEIVGVRFKPVGKIYFFDPKGFQFVLGDKVIVETVRGYEIGTIAVANKNVEPDNKFMPLSPVIRPATEEDLRKCLENKEKEASARRAVTRFRPPLVSGGLIIQEEKKCGRKREEGEGQRLMISRNRAETLASAAPLPPLWRELQTQSCRAGGAGPEPAPMAPLLSEGLLRAPARGGCRGKALHQPLSHLSPCKRVRGEH